LRLGVQAKLTGMRQGSSCCTTKCGEKAWNEPMPMLRQAGNVVYGEHQIPWTTFRDDG
jgi:hypothetical protein